MCRSSIFAMLLLACSFEASAVGSAANVRVLNVRVDNDGKGMVVFDKPITGTPPDCVTPGYASALAFSGTNGKSIMALALTAKATGTPLDVVYGTGTCGTYGVVEDWRYGQ